MCSVKIAFDGFGGIRRDRGAHAVSDVDDERLVLRGP
jgi:hypothetical protein